MKIMAPYLSTRTVWCGVSPLPLFQVVEAIMCMFQGGLTSKRVTLGLEDVQTVVQSDIQCRACTDVNRPGEISDRQESLLNNGCIADYDICRYV